MINLFIDIISIIAWIIIFMFKPYYYTKTKFWTMFWIILFSVIGGIVGCFGCQSIIYLCGGHTFLN